MNARTRDYRAIREALVMALAAFALVWSGLVAGAFGEVRLAWGMIGVGVAAFVAAAQVRA